MKTARLAPWLAAGFLAVLPIFGDAPAAQQPPAQAPATDKPATEKPAVDVPNPTFRTSVNLVSSDVIVRNRRGQFQADLAKDDFEVYEDGVKQELNSFTLVHGGRVYQTQTATPRPCARASSCRRRGRSTTPPGASSFSSSTIFTSSSAIRTAFAGSSVTWRKSWCTKAISFGIVSTGTSSIAIDLTYDRTRMEEAANKITGGGLKPSEIIQQSSTGETPQEVMHRANVAFETVYDMLNNLQQTQHRRKAVVLISNGYDFDPFAGSRAGTADSVFLNNRNVDPNDPSNALYQPGEPVQ